MTENPEEVKAKGAGVLSHQPQAGQQENGVQVVGARHRHHNAKPLLQSGDDVSVESVSTVSLDNILRDELLGCCPTEPAKRVPDTSFILRLSTWLSVALLFRLLLLGFSLWQDVSRWPDGELRFTDVDYDVFTDAAEALARGENMYEARPTYRYSPLIACLLVPGHWLFRADGAGMMSNLSGDGLPAGGGQSVTDGSLDVRLQLARMWGKLVFILADLGCACLQYTIIHQEAKLRCDAKPGGQSKAGLAVPLIVFAWLFNPVTAVVSVRGNAEAVLGMCVLACLYATLTDRLPLAGCLFGLSIHLKLYPVIYGPAVYLWLLDHDRATAGPTKTTEGRRHCWSSSLLAYLPNRRHFIFGLSSLASLLVLTGIGYRYFGGMQFLHHAYLYHFTRTDIKHNFAPHFYPLYLLSGSLWRANETQQSLPMASGGNVNWHLLTRLTSAMNGLMGGGWFSAELGSGTAAYFSWASPGWILWLYRLFGCAVMLPAVFLVLGLSVKLYRWPSLCWLVITHAFVTFNKVCTSQYFLWSLVLLPPTLASIRLSPGQSGRNPVYRLVCSCVLIWFGAQIVWLSAAYVLEMRTASTALVAVWSWRAVWAASLLYVAANVVLLRQFIRLRGSPLLPLFADKGGNATVAGDGPGLQLPATLGHENRMKDKDE